MTMALLINLQ